MQKAENELNAQKKKGASASTSEKLQKELEKISEQAEHKKRIGNDSLEMLTANPVTHSRQYLMLAGEFKKNIDRNNIEDLKGTAREMKNVEIAYQKRLEVLRDLATHPDFQSKFPLPFYSKTRKRLAFIGEQAKEMSFNAQGMASFLEKFSNSVNADPHGWVKQLQVAAPAAPSTSSTPST